MRRIGLADEEIEQTEVMARLGEQIARYFREPRARRTAPPWASGPALRYRGGPGRTLRTLWR